MNEFLRYDSWFTKKYFDKLDNRYRHGRFHTTKAALNILSQRSSHPLIVETGCMRENDWGAGCSTLLFADYIDHYGGRLISIDNNPEHIRQSKLLVQSNNVVWLEDDSIEQLKHLFLIPDLLYLDSFDYPFGELLDIYGGKTDINKAIEILWGMSEEEVVTKHHKIFDACQEHCLNEIKSAPLGASTIVLIDDAILPGGGKARLAKEWLASNGWVCILDLYQTLWIKG